MTDKNARSENLFLYGVKVFLVVGIAGVVIVLLGFSYLTRDNNASKPMQNTTDSQPYSSSSSNYESSYRDTDYQDYEDNRYSDYDYDYDTGYNDYEESCDIKGNVSYNTGERIYHVPGQTYYDQTTISEAYGEYWFCSEEEAQAAGWRRSYR